jgi:hypothetical protein
MMLTLSALLAYAAAVNWNLATDLAPLGTIPVHQNTGFCVTAEPSTGACEGAGITGAVGATDSALSGASFLSFSVDGKPVVCDATQDPPCLARENKPRPFLPTGVVYEPIRTNFDHMKATLRYDVIHVNDEATAAIPGYVAVRGLLALSNPTHVTRHADVAVNYHFGDSYDVLATANGDTVIDSEDNWAIVQDQDAYVLVHLYSPCTDHAHHFDKKSVSNDGCESSNNGIYLDSKVMVHEDHVSIVAGVFEIFPEDGGDGYHAAYARARSIDRRSDQADLHWFGDLAEKERLAIVNHCVDDDDGEDSDDDDSSSSDSSISTSDFEGSAFNFEFHGEKCDNPIYSDKALRYKDDFSSEFSSSKIYTSTVDRVSDPSSWTKSTSTSDKKEHKAHKAHKSGSKINWSDILQES